jgi:hypothetical protein
MPTLDKLISPDVLQQALKKAYPNLTKRDSGLVMKLANDMFDAVSRFKATQDVVADLYGSSSIPFYCYQFTANKTSPEGFFDHGNIMRAEFDRTFEARAKHLHRSEVEPLKIEKELFVDTESDGKTGIFRLVFLKTPNDLEFYQQYCKQQTYPSGVSEGMQKKYKELVKNNTIKTENFIVFSAQNVNAKRDLFVKQNELIVVRTFTFPLLDQQHDQELRMRTLIFEVFEYLAKDAQRIQSKFGNHETVTNVLKDFSKEGWFSRHEVLKTLKMTDPTYASIMKTFFKEAAAL